MTCQSVPIWTLAPRTALFSNEPLVTIGYRLTLDISATMSRNATVRCGLADMCRSANGPSTPPIGLSTGAITCWMRSRLDASSVATPYRNSGRPRKSSSRSTTRNQPKRGTSESEKSKIHPSST